MLESMPPTSKATTNDEGTCYQRLLLPRSPADLKRSIESASRRAVELQITSNRRTMLRSIPQLSGPLKVRAHGIFLYAPKNIIRMLARFLSNPFDRAASQGLDTFIAGEAARLEADRRPPRGLASLKSNGRVYDLMELFSEVNAQEFEGSVKARIGWSRRSKTRRRSILFGSYRAGKPGLIRVHPALDDPEIPRRFVKYIVFHEMLHALIPVRYAQGRRLVHPPEFQAREKSYLDYDFARRWEKHNLHRFLDGIPAPTSLPALEGSRKLEDKGLLWETTAP
jgi:hypothetical protein